MPTEAAPAAWAAISLHTHSGRLSPMIATLSPRPTPSATRPSEKSRTWSWYCAPRERLPDPELLLAHRDAVPVRASVPHEEPRERVVPAERVEGARGHPSASSSCCSPR